MNILFFLNEDNSLDPNSVGAGVYSFRIGRTNGDRSSFIPLYVGESYSMAARCADHLYEISQNKNHMAIPYKYYSNNDLCLMVEVYESIKIPEGYTTGQRDILLQQHELEAIKKLKPISQNTNNDNLKENADKEVSKVLDKLLEETL